MEKRKAHHDLAAIQSLFANGNGPMTRTAIRSAQAIGYLPSEICEVICELEPKHFVKSATAHNPVNPNCWHDTYIFDDVEIELFIKFAGEDIENIVLTSFKER
ncbi:type II toxin-antitoxin system MqsR family toxin [Novosphingobium sp. TCA1]|uniref:type II toxin-antitoxin system MqsR family toxin n=1 Tax=Novosphingobium sp. TCA1 TaxID=2682474 RepID=UPI0013095B16|nr:type II toxin-antitoxin system MqsR family toxin [Novosphingobium sp. TCA1]GFE77526.1 hypothetical protein NTCA1_51750 [Novosphingobium sp. TCA1]